MLSQGYRSKTKDLGEYKGSAVCPKSQNPYDTTLFHKTSAKIPFDSNASLVVGCLTKFMLTTNILFDTGIIFGKIHCSRNFIMIGVVLKQILID